VEGKALFSQLQVGQDEPNAINSYLRMPPIKPTSPVKNSRRGVSIRWSIFRTLLLLVLFVSGSLFVITAFTAGKSIRALSERLIEEATTETRLRLQAFFEPVNDDLQILSDLAEHGEFDPRNGTSSKSFFSTLLKQHPQTTAIFWGSTTGEARLVARSKGGWIMSHMPADPSEPAQLETFEPESCRTLKVETTTRFDPRERPWYKAAKSAVDPGKVQWTAPYRFLTGNLIGVTGVTEVNMPDDEEIVLAMDVSLASVVDFLRALKPSPGGRAFLLSEDGTILSAEHFGPMESMRPLQMGDADFPVKELARHAMNAETLNVVHHSPDWWCGILPFTTQSGQKFRIGVLIPQRDLIHERKEFRGVLLSVTLAALLIATVLTLWVSRGYSDPIRRLVAQSERIEKLDIDNPLNLRTSLRELDRLADAQEKMRQALASFSRYVPVNVVRDLLAQGAAAEIGGELREITVLFSDIAGFTPIAERLSPEQLTEQMAEYFDVMVTTLLEHDATVDKFIGDAIMAFWGAPKSLKNHAAVASRAVLRCSERLKELNARWAAECRPQLPTRFGIATGMATVGNVGAAFRLSYTALGDTVNLAQRLESLNSETRTWILASGATRAAAGDEFEWREIGATLVKGRRQYVSVFELVGFSGVLNPEVTTAEA
jgi:adenylate cyclase